MRKLKIKSKTHKASLLSMTGKIYEGWKVVKGPRKNWLGIWVCKLEKVEDK